MTDTAVIPTAGSTIADRLRDPRTIVALGLAALGLGIIIGWKLAGGDEIATVVDADVKGRHAHGGGVVVERCRSCDEKHAADLALLNARAANERAADTLKETVTDAVFGDAVDFDPSAQFTVPETFDPMRVENPRVFSPHDHPAADSSLPDDPA